MLYVFYVPVVFLAVQVVRNKYWHAVIQHPVKLTDPIIIEEKYETQFSSHVHTLACLEKEKAMQACVVFKKSPKKRKV